jgi:protein TonB
MRRETLQSDRADRAKAASAALVIHLVLGAAFLTGLALHPIARPEEHLQTFDVYAPPPTITQPMRAPAKGKPALAGKKAEPSPIVAPPATIPDAQPVRAALVAGTAVAASAGTAPSGTGAGGSGNGLGSGGGGSGGARVGAMLISGRLDRRDYRTIAGGDLPEGSAMYVLLVAPSGQVERCRAAAGSGVARIDQAICAMLTARLRFRPAMESDGRPLYQDVNYVARWGR